MKIIKKSDNKKCWKECGEIGAFIAGGNASGVTALTSFGMALQRLNINLPYNLAIPLL